MSSRTYDLYIYNTINDAERINTLHETFEDIKKLKDELESRGAWLWKTYNEKYRKFAITNSAEQYTLKEKFTKKLGVFGEIKKVPMFVDIMNRLINLDDNVAYIQNSLYGTSFKEGKVIGFTEKRIKVKLKSGDICNVSSNNIICTK